MQNDDDFNISDISITEFNNKDVKGDDDFDSWISDSAITCTADTSTTPSTFTLGNTYTITGTDSSAVSTKKIQNLKYSMPIDLLYKWFPHEVKECDEYDDQVPF
jgi:hypothetical protein